MYIPIPIPMRDPPRTAATRRTAEIFAGGLFDQERPAII